MTARGAADASALPSRGGTDNDRGMPLNPDWMASGRQVKCAAGGGGDGGRIGVERGVCPDSSVWHRISKKKFRAKIIIAKPGCDLR